MLSHPPALEEEFYHRYYAIDEEFHQDFYIDEHYNGLCLIGIAKSHPIRRCLNNLTIENISFDIGSRKLGDYKVYGKRKTNAITTQSNTILAKMNCVFNCNSNESTTISYPIFGIVQGKILEINQECVKNAKLVQSDGDCDGYIFIIQSNKNQKFSINDQLYNTKENDNDIKQENDNDNENDDNDEPLKKKQKLNKTANRGSITDSILKYCQLSDQEKGKHQQIFRKDKICIVNEQQYVKYCQSNGFFDILN